MIDRDALAAILKAYGGIGEKMPRDLDVALDAILCLIPGEEGARPDPKIEALRACRLKFIDYAQQHDKKCTVEADAKAAVNRSMAKMCEDALK